MIKETELKAPKGKIIVRQLQAAEMEREGIIIPAGKTFYNKEALVISIGDMDNGEFKDINCNNKKRKNILKVGDHVLLSFMPVDRYEALGPDNKKYFYATINPCQVLLVGQNFA